MNLDDYTQSLGAVMAQERANPRPWPLRRRDQVELFETWMRLNPDAAREMELVAVSMHEKGFRVSTKYLVERQRYEGSVRLVPVPFFDERGVEHRYGISNSITPMLARWLLKRHPDMRIVTKRSIYDEEVIGNGDDQAGQGGD